MLITVILVLFNQPAALLLKLQLRESPKTESSR